MSRQSIVPAQPRRRVGEMAGVTAAECAAVCCCFPCAVVHFVVLAVYTVPKGLLKKAVHKRITKRRRLLKEKTDKDNENDVVLLQQHQQKAEETDSVVTLEEPMAKEPKEAVALENEMWARFSGTGFWRSESQRQP